MDPKARILPTKTKQLKTVPKTTDNEVAKLIILHDKLTNVYDCSDGLQLGISFSKCNVMYVGCTICDANLSVNVNMLPFIDRVKNLGVIIDSHLILITYTKFSQEHSPVLT